MLSTRWNSLKKNLVYEFILILYEVCWKLGIQWKLISLISSWILKKLMKNMCCGEGGVEKNQTMKIYFTDFWLYFMKNMRWTSEIGIELGTENYGFFTKIIDLKNYRLISEILTWKKCVISSEILWKWTLSDEKYNMV